MSSIALPGKLLAAGNHWLASRDGEGNPREVPCVVLAGDAIGEWERALRLLALVEGERRDEAIERIARSLAMQDGRYDESDYDDPEWASVKQWFDGKAVSTLAVLLALLDAPEPQP